MRCLLLLPRGERLLTYSVYIKYPVYRTRPLIFGSKQGPPPTGIICSEQECRAQQVANAGSQLQVWTHYRLPVNSCVETVDRCCWDTPPHLDPLTRLLRQPAGTVRDRNLRGTRRQDNKPIHISPLFVEFGSKNLGKSSQIREKMSKKKSFFWRKDYVNNLENL